MKEPVYEKGWRNRWVTAEAKSIDEMIRLLTESVEVLTAMQQAGVQLYRADSTTDDYAILTTTDCEVARRFGMEVWEGVNAEEEEPVADPFPDWTDPLPPPAGG